jgi:hypothetical protein
MKLAFVIISIAALPPTLLLIRSASDPFTAASSNRMTGGFPAKQTHAPLGKIGAEIQ